MLKRIFLPKDEVLLPTIYWLGWTLAIGIGIYLFRAEVNLAFWKDPLLGVLIGLMCVITIPLLALLLAIPCTAAVMAFRKSLAIKHPAPFLVYVFGMAIAIFLSLPSLPPLPEETHFASYREDYEQVVEMAKLSQLEHGSCHNEYAIPTEYQHLSQTGCIWIEYSQGLSVDFNPLDRFYTRIVYFEVPEDVQHSFACASDGRIRFRINNHWYICEHEWN